MSRATGVVAVVAALLLLGAIYLYRENARLSERVAELEAAAGEGAAAEDRDRALPLAPSVARANRGGLLSRLGRPSGVDRPELPEPRKETRQQRRLRRQEEIRSFLGRAPGETAAEYIARMKPLIEMGLAGPRERLSEARAEAERLAGVTGEQRAALDGVFEDVYDEAMALTNNAIASGDLSPYERNWAGAAQLVGGLGAILEGAEGRIAGVLSPDQIRIIRGSGFEWGEYLGANAPWENLDPPPPPPPDDDADDGS